MARNNLTICRASHRLVPAKYADESVLENLQLEPATTYLLSALDAATNERIVAESGNTPEIGPRELLFGVPEAAVINAAFTHSGPFGGRFHSAGRGAWYAGVRLRTSQAEVAYHRLRFLRDSEIDEPVASEYQDFVADLWGNFHRLSRTKDSAYLQPEPVPQCYRPGQALAQKLLAEGFGGIVYPSARDPEGTCIACFRPALVTSPRRGDLLELSADPVTGKCRWKKLFSPAP
ncbi:MAG: RES family NAD+ phosphorylase [Acidobacteriaceae bacterium]|nr:RES family NAD+ phosphorylase [Acidobacteriaceae bacterium]